MLIELPNGDWIDPKAVQGVRLMDDRQYGPRIAIDSRGQEAAYFFEMDNTEVARVWVKDFCAKCNQQSSEIV